MKEEDNKTQQQETAADGEEKLWKEQGHWKDSAWILAVAGTLFSFMLNSVNLVFASVFEQALVRPSTPDVSPELLCCELLR